MVVLLVSALLEGDVATRGGGAVFQEVLAFTRSADGSQV